MSEYYEVTPVLRATHMNRYKNCKYLKDLETGETILSTRESIDVPTHKNDKFHRVAANEVGRLDLIANQYYKNPLMWWVIAQANDVFDQFTPIEIGTLLRIPAIETLYGNNGILL